MKAAGDPDVSIEHDHSTYVPRIPGPDEPSLQAPSVEQILGPPPELVPPVLGGLAPASIVAGAGPVPVTVSGSGFTTRAQVWSDEEAQHTTYVSDTELSYQAQADQPGTQTITVHDEGVSAAIELTVTATKSRS